MVPEPFTVDEKGKRRLISEARILLHPDLMYSNDIYVDATPRFPMEPSRKSEYEYLTHLTCMAMIGDWLSEGNKTMEGAFRTPPVAKILFHQVHKGLTGTVPEERLSSEGFFQLVRHGLVEAVQEYIQTYPEILKETAEEKDRLLIAAFKSDTPEMLDLVFKLLQLDLSQEEVTKLLRIAKDSNLPKAMSFLATYIKQGMRGYAPRFLPVLYFLLQPEGGFLDDPVVSLEKRISLLPLLFEVSSLPEWAKAKLMKQLFTQIPDKITVELCCEYFFPQNLILPQDVLTYLHGLLSSTSFGMFNNYGLSYQQLFLQFLRISDSLTPETVLGLAQWKVPLCKDLLDYLSTYREYLVHRNQEGLTLLGAAQKEHLEGHACENLPSLQSLYHSASVDLREVSYPPFVKLYGTTFKPRDTSDPFYMAENTNSGFIYGENRRWAMSLANASPEDYPKLAATCPDEKLFRRFEKKLNTLQLSSCMKMRLSAHDKQPWSEKVYRFFSKKRQGPALKVEKYDPLSSLRSVFSSLPHASLGLHVLGEQEKAIEQFPEKDPMRDLVEDESPKDFSELVADIPESLETLDKFLTALQKQEFWATGIVEYVQSLPEYEAVIVPAFKGRQERLREKKRVWRETLQRLVDEKNKGQVYEHVQSMPFLSKDEEREVREQLAPFYPTEEQTRATYPWELFNTSTQGRWMPAIDKLVKAGSEQASHVHKFIDLAPSSALRASLVLFLTKEGASYLPMLLQKAYQSAQDFAGTYEFRIEHEDPISKLPETYRHPFPFILRSENPATLVRIFLPLLDGQFASILLKHLDQQQFWKIIKQNKPQEVESLVGLIPWLFQWSTPGKDFFLFSIQNMPKPALRRLVQQSHAKLKTSETEKRCLPYFVHLMMDGQNADMIQEALQADPALLEIRSLDEMNMEDFLTWYASPAVVKVVRNFQKLEK